MSQFLAIPRKKNGRFVLGVFKITIDQTPFVFLMKIQNTHKKMLGLMRDDLDSKSNFPANGQPKA